MKKWKQRGFAFVLALSLTTGMLTGAQAAVSKETLNEAVQDTAEYMYRTVQNPQVGSIGGEWAVLGLARSGYDVPDSYCKEEEILPKLSRELGINDLAQRVEAFRKEPSPEGENIKGRKRTTLKLMIPNLTFSEPVDMGENVWIYMGDLCPAYCLYTPWEDSEAAE